MSAAEIESKLRDGGYGVDGVVCWRGRKSYYAVGFEASELPEIDGYKPRDDPALSDQS